MQMMATISPEEAEALAQRLEATGWRPAGERDEAAAALRALAARIVALEAQLARHTSMPAVGTDERQKLYPHLHYDFRDWHLRRLRQELEGARAATDNMREKVQRANYRANTAESRASQALARVVALDQIIVELEAD